MHINTYRYIYIYIHGNVQFKFTQNIKQCICCDDLFIRLVKPLREESSYKNNDDEDSQFIGYDGFY